MNVIFWDTNLFIYLFEPEKYAPFHDRVIHLRELMLKQGDQLVTSTLTMGEVLIQPIRVGRRDLVDRYRSVFQSKALILISIDSVVAERYAFIRAKYNRQEVKPPDALQLACAAAFGVDLFITNDDRLSQRSVDGIKRICSLAEAMK